MIFKPVEQMKNNKLVRPKTPRDLGYYFCFLSGQIPLIKYTLEDNGFKQKEYNSTFTLLWGIKREPNMTYQLLAPYQKVLIINIINLKINHFPKSFEITRKDKLNRNISKMEIDHGRKNFNFIPKSYIFP